MGETRKKLKLRHDVDDRSTPETVPNAPPALSDSTAPRYHPSHDPQLVSDDEIPW
ncbi:hypothetical protein K3M67_20290 (plasmid) [Sphingobium sp. V4]|uniref:hypothetical protein n=1 Tax=Sphingobium sp. V4 TaxID=3038927 RepID=UPI002557F213|nr:hypothetical protein [Sphingobium sp. V4]WIW90371.1 hypothetical protein K3M67_20290 [Sphingobium sp. V4]